MLKFIHLSDLHLVAPGHTVWGLSPHDRLERCLGDIAKWHGDAAFMVITGDLADQGERLAYHWLKAQIEQFPLTTHLMIGNHDERGAFQAVFGDAPCDENGYVQFTFACDCDAQTPGVAICLDTFKPGTSAGELCCDRLDWFERELDRADGRPVWVFMHHPPFDIGIAYMDRIKLEQTDRFAEIVARHTNIRHIFFGHVHRAAAITWHGITCTCLPAVPHQIPLSRESVGGAPYSDETMMYGVVLLEEDQTTVHFEAFEGRGPADMSDREKPQGRLPSR